MIGTPSLQERLWTIYKITSPSNRIYIGRTLNYRNRLNQYNHIGMTKQQRLVHHSFQEHGKDAHSFEVIDTFMGSLDYADGKEMFWIRSHMSNFSKWPEMNGLNLTNGGSGTRGLKHTPEVVERMAARFRGKKLTQEHRDKIAKKSKERGNMKVGTRQSEETKRKISISSKGRKKSEKFKEMMRGRKKIVPIVCYYENGDFYKEFKSIKSAEVEFNLSVQSLNNYLKKQYIKDSAVTKTGFIFKYK